MKPIRLLAGMICALIFAAPIAHAEEPPTTLAFHYKVGDTASFQITLIEKILGVKVEVNVNEKKTITEVNKDGSFVVSDVDTRAVAKGADQVVGIDTLPPIIRTYDKTGRLQEEKAPKDDAEDKYLAPGTIHLMTLMIQTYLPEKPVKVNENWEMEIDNPVISEKKVVMKMTYDGIVKVDNQSLWQISQTGEADINRDGDTMFLETTLWLNPKNGMLVKMDALCTEVPTALGPLSWKAKIVTIPPDTTKTPPAKTHSAASHH